MTPQIPGNQETVATDSEVIDTVELPRRRAGRINPSAAAETTTVESDRSIGDLMSDANALSADQIQSILDYQRQHGVRFGEAAVALGFATNEDVLYALSQQFHYPYASDDRRGVNPELVVAAQPFSRQAEAFRAIRSQLMLRVFDPSEPKRALAVVSPNSGDGKTFFAANISVALAQLGGRVLLVDADLRGPRLHQVFGIPNNAGLSSILSGRQESNVIYQAPDIPSLFVMPVGIIPPNPLELIERPAFRLLLGELLRKFDHVIVDTPAAQYGTDAAVVGSKCGAGLIIARRDKSRVKGLNDLIGMMTASTAKLAGVIYNEF